MEGLRNLPSVNTLLGDPAGAALSDGYGHALTVQALRQALEEARQAYTGEGEVPMEPALLERAAGILSGWTAPTLKPVINASGVIIHTNLGRAPLSAAATQAMNDVAHGYSNLEYQLDRGQRGSRLTHTEAVLTRLTGAEAALAVNNNAAAVLLALTALARRRRVVIARSQLVEIGGGFRIPDVMRQSGARLVEIGTTNRVHLSDYTQAFEEPIAAVLRAHRSNFRIIGFTTEPGLEDISGAAHAAGVPVVDDLGSGALLDTAAYGLGHEPTVQESLAAGADLVCFSGDKLVGGPQSGIIVGRQDLVARLKKHPLARAVRADKLCLAALSATLTHYLKDEAVREIPVWRMIAAGPETLRERAAGWAGELGRGEVVQGQSTVGGGSLPEEMLPTWLLALDVRSPTRFAARLRGASPPVVARVQDDRVMFDPRTVLAEQDADLLSAIRAA